jgi:ribosomal protein S18 acetylase RimI-like enzyme
MIRKIEELSMNAWPALQTLHYDGWVLRFAAGYTKRANSVYPLYPSRTGLDEKIRACELLYRARNLPAVFKLTRDSAPEELDASLDALGYRVDSPTSVQLLDISQEKFRTDGDVKLANKETKAWHEAFARMNNVSPENSTTHESILRAILPEKCCAAVYAGKRIIGCGLGVLQAACLGIFDLVIDSDHRGQGLGTNLMIGLLAWGQERGANLAYLQVMQDNESAMSLYKKIGFQEKYRYWYRIYEP